MKDKLKWLAAFAIPVFGYLMFETTTGNLLHISFPRAVYQSAFLLFPIHTGVSGGEPVSGSGCRNDGSIVYSGGGQIIMCCSLKGASSSAAGSDSLEDGGCSGIQLSHHVRKISGLRRSASYFDASADLAAAHGKADWKKRGIAAGCYVLCLTAWLLAFYRYDIKYTLAGIDDDVFWWSLEGSYQDFGYVTSTAILAKSMIIEKPAGYSVSEAARIGETVSYESTPVSETTPENLIVIMNESLSDMRVIRDFQTNQEYFPFISSLTDNTIRGNLYVQVFGGEPVIQSMRF